MSSKLPWFPFFPNDYLSDSNVIAMNRAQRGSYANLLCIAWNMQPKGTLPDDDELLAAWAQCSAEEWADDKPCVMRPFELADGVWTQKRMSHVGIEQIELHNHRVEAGRKGGFSKAVAQLEQSYSPALQNQNQNQNQTEASLLARDVSKTNGVYPPAGKQASEHLLDLSEASIEELQAEHPRLVVRALMAKAEKRCAKRHPHGGPMKLPFFRAFLEREERNLDPPGLIAAKKEKAEQLAEAARDRTETEHEATEEEGKQVAEGLRNFRKQNL